MHIHHDEKRNPIDFGSRGQRSRSTLALFGTLCIRPCGHNSDFSFCSLSNFTCTFTMMRRETLLNWVTGTFKLHMHIHHDEKRNPIDFGVKGSTLALFGTLCIRPCGHNSDFSFCSITFKLHMHIHHDEKRNPIDFGSRGQRSRSTLALFGTLCIRPCGHNSDFSFCSITFKLHMHIHHDERRNPIDFGSRGQRSKSTLALCV